jgi:phosphoglycolate phosphatase
VRHWPNMQWNNIHAVLFDLDGTLFDTAQEINAAANLMLAEINAPAIDTAVSQKLIGKGAHNFVERALKAVGVSPRLQDQAVISFLKHYETVTATLAPAYPGVLQGLEELAALKISMACVTNKQTNLALKLLRTHKIEHYFSIVMGGDLMERKKPDAWPVLEVCRQLNILPEQGLFVGDSDSDVDAAKAAGMRCTVLPYGYSGARSFDELGADSVISTLLEIVQHVRQDVNRRK